MLDSSKFLFEALTYDDVLLLPAYSEVLPREVSTQTRLTKNITLNVPILSAAMDTVTEAELAIAMAQSGGIGIIHKNMTIAQQAEQVRKVKRSESGMIIDPVTLTVDKTLGDAQKIMRESKIGGIPIIDNTGKLVGILTNRDLRFQKNMARPVTEVMTTENLITAKKGRRPACPRRSPCTCLCRLPARTRKGHRGEPGAEGPNEPRHRRGAACGLADRAPYGCDQIGRAHV